MLNNFRIAILVLVLISIIPSPIYAIGIGHDNKIGDYLIDSNGMALYFFINDIPYSGISNCYGNCADVWHPVFESITSPLKAEDFSGITRMDGSFQMTYKGHPLYWYELDQKGKIDGDGKYDLWFLMRL
jgi:predicted lipoprotein with Yx(FWY)xxD motif